MAAPRAAKPKKAPVVRVVHVGDRDFTLRPDVEVRLGALVVYLDRLETAGDNVAAQCRASLKLLKAWTVEAEHEALETTLEGLSLAAVADAANDAMGAATTLPT